MKIFNRANNYVIRTLGRQNRDGGVSYRQSRFVITEGDAAYNSLTGECLFQADEDTLLQRWFLVPEDMDETMLAYMVRQKWLTLGHGPGQEMKHRFIIFFTTDCNGNCIYCFEKGMDKMHMTEQTALDVADYITEHCDKSADNMIRLFGGEPLVNIPAIEALTERLRNNGVNFHSYLFSNGDRLNLVDSKTLIDKWHVRNVQLTAEDIGSEYDRIKGLPAGAWDRLTENIRRLGKDGVRINMRIHYHPGEGWEGPKRLVDALDSFPEAHMYTVMLYETASKEDYDGLLALEDYISSKGKYRWPFPSVFFGRACMADDRRSVCITPDGHLSPCEHYPYGHDYGSIYGGKYDADVLSRWAAKQRNYCTKCVHYPSCGIQHMCPAQSACSEAEVYYKTEKIKRAMRARL